jgi:glycerol-3-phosphate acyltransferase PlsY
MVNFLYIIIAAGLGYLWGAIPFGYLYVKKVKGVDLTTVGSGRTGGTNSFRAAGLKVGLVTVFSDVFKGAMSVILARWIFGSFVNEVWLPWILVTAGVFSVIGHNWSIFLDWRGGAGTGPNVGWATAVWWPMFLIGAVVMSAMLRFVGIASVASLTMAAIIPLTFAGLYLAGVPGYDNTLAYIVGGIAAALVVTWSLRPNIKRLIAGDERVVGPRAKKEQETEKVNT